jgi:hypothetical protein
VAGWPAGALRRAARNTAAAMLAFTPVLYAAFPPLARGLQHLDRFDRNQPYRDDYIYALPPWAMAERSAERMSRAAIGLAAPDGFIIYEDAMAEFALRYRAIRDGLAGKVDIDWSRKLPEGDELKARLHNRKVVLVPANRDRPRMTPPGGQWERHGDLYLLVPDAGRSAE